MNKLPSTQGGAAGSFVRGNEFFADRPTPYSTTKRGEDTITVDPYGITARRAPRKAGELPLELVTALRYTASQLGNGSQDWEPYYGMRHLHGLTLSDGDTGSETLGDEEQSRIWENPQRFQQNGNLTPVGDGYFVSVGHPYLLPDEVPPSDQLEYFRARVGLVHKSNLNGPYLSTLTRIKAEGGGVLDPIKLLKGGQSQPDRPGDRFQDARGSNYLLAECEGLWQSIYNLASSLNLTGPKVSVVPLGWMDASHRYAFAVFGMNIASTTGALSCYVYCTGTRALVHRWDDLPRLSDNENFPWVRNMGDEGSFPTLACLGRGVMGVVLLPRMRQLNPVTGLPVVASHAVALGKDPCLLYSQDFGRSWLIQPLPELQAIGRAQADGAYKYPPLRAQLTAINAGGEFVLSVAALNAKPSGDIASASFDALGDELLQRKLYLYQEDSDSRWNQGGYAARMSCMTLFKGRPGQPLQRLDGCDGLQLRFENWLRDFASVSADLTPAGVYDYHCLLNGDRASRTPRLLCLGENSVAFLALRVTVDLKAFADNPATIDFNSAIFAVPEVFAMQSDDGGQSWAKHVLPPELVPFNDVQAYLKQFQQSESDPASGWNKAPGWAAMLPGREYLPWCVVQSARFGSKERLAKLAFVVRQVDGAAVFVTQSTKRQYQGLKGWTSAWTVKRKARLAPEAFLPVRSMEYDWDAGAFRAPPAVMYLGDRDSEEYPDWIWPALPGVLEKQ